MMFTYNIKRIHDWLDFCVSIAFCVIGIAHVECCFGGTGVLVLKRKDNYITGGIPFLDTFRDGMTAEYVTYFQPRWVGVLGFTRFSWSA
jgi:hypothetical protein